MGDSEELCVASEMNAALDPYQDVLIDIRVDENWERWHKTPGLRCLLCRRVVTAYQSSTKNRFVRHLPGEGGTATGSAKKTAQETFLHQRFKFWVRDELRAAGATAEVEQQLGERRPDVLASRDGRRFAVEIQWSPLNVETARQRTASLRSAGADEIMWLARGYTWVEKLSTLGVPNFNPGSDGYTTDSGFLAINSRGELRVRARPVGQALRQWLDGEIAWAYRDFEKAGWATVTDWAQHTKQQADAIERLRGELAQTTEERNRLRTTVGKQSGLIDAVRSDLEGAETKMAAQKDAIDEGVRQHDRDTEIIDKARTLIEKVMTERDRQTEAVAIAETSLDSEREAHERTAASLAWRSRTVKILLAVCLVLALLAFLGGC